MNRRKLHEAFDLLQLAVVENNKTGQTTFASRKVMTLVIDAACLVIVALLGACSSTSFTMNESTGGESWQPDSSVSVSTTSDAAQAGSIGIGGFSSMRNSGSTAAIAGSSNSLGTGGMGSQQSSVGGQAATGGTTADAGDCLCPDNPSCAPRGAACNESTTQLGQVTDKLTCVRLPSECPTAEFNVYCFEC